ncbi:putative bifunctional diguanylate cyclase/phosphodiesterase [Croceibacterium soli]|nr:EAL domain-containing protein [Croceibacterium soli]
MNVQRLADLQGIIDVMPTPVFVKNRAHRIILLNESACELFGHSREVMLSSSDYDLFPAEQAEVFHAADDRVFSLDTFDEVEEQVTNAVHCVRTVITRKKKVEIGGEELLVAVVTDVTAYREAEARSRYLALHDVLTGLPNRMLLNERIDQELLRASRRESQAALIYIDLDRFKEVNDSMGHQAGDELIRQFAERLTAIVRASDTVARLGGDEFAILLHDAGDGVQSDEICNRVLAAARRPFMIEQGQAHVGASLGIAHLGSGMADRAELHRRADVALYQAKREGRGCFRIFSDELDARIQARRALETDLRCALAAGDQLKIDYQPLLSARDDRVMALEALVRWDHPRLGRLTPADFLDVAEESGLIVPLGEWVLERACATMAKWPDVSLAVNISPGQLSSDALVERVLKILDRTGFDPTRLQLEVTEHAILDMEGAVETLKELRATGIKLVLDDFGTGYSSLSHLQKIEIDKVKIDRSFVAEMSLLGGSSAIVQAVATLGSSLGISVTAEGVETEEQRAFLRALGCEELQGYLLSRPMNENETGTYMERSTAASQAA